MRRRVNAHRQLVRVLGRDAPVHLEQVAVALGDDAPAQAPDGVGEIEVDAQTGLADAAALVADFLRGTRGDVARAEVAVAWVLTLEKVVALAFGDGVRGALVVAGLGHPDTAVVPQRLAHQGELGLIAAADRDAGRMDLRVARVRKGGAALVSAPDRGRVRAARVGREKEDVGIAAGR